MALERVERYSAWDGRNTHADYYDGNRLVQRSVERTSIWGGKPTKTEYYDKHWNKIGERKY